MDILPHACIQHVRVRCLQTHFRVECSDQELPDRDGRTFGEEGTDTEVVIDAFHLRSVKGAIRHAVIRP